VGNVQRTVSGMFAVYDVLGVLELLRSELFLVVRISKITEFNCSKCNHEVY
jgi:hypothetical protein